MLPAQIVKVIIINTFFFIISLSWRPLVVICKGEHSSMLWPLEFILLFVLQVQDVTMEIQDLLQWLENTDMRLSSSKTMWSMPDSASERLNAHLVKRARLLTVKIKRYGRNEKLVTQ